ncbi:hypothetical protein [Microcystis phage MinS1]|nr:hypothetical protein [Microcystis phage MinS1]
MTHTDAVYPIARIVEAPSLAAPIHFDFHGHDDYVRWHVMREGFTIGAPSMDGDSEAVRPELGTRVISFPLMLVGRKDAVAGVLGQLARILLSKPMWLYVQLGESVEPVWFELQWARVGELDFSQVSGNREQDHWTLPIELPAEALAVGERRTLTVATVQNDPAATTNPLNVVLPEVVGDAPAPLRIEARPTNPTQMPGYRWMLATYAAKTERRPIVWQFGPGDGFTSHNGTTTKDFTGTAADGEFSENTGRNVPFEGVSTTTDLVDRVTGLTPTIPAAGRWRVMLRLGQVGIDFRFSVRFGQRAGAGYDYGPIVTNERYDTVSGAARTTWLDLGEYSFPKYGPPPGENPGFATAPDIALQVGRLAEDVTGTGVNLDCLMLIPVDADDAADRRALYSEFPIEGIDAEGGYGVWDAQLERFWCYNRFGIASPARAVSQGGWPTAVPGRANTLTVMQQVNGAEPLYGEVSPDLLNVATELTISYQPQLLWLGGL